MQQQLSGFALATVAFWVLFTLYIAAAANSAKSDSAGQKPWARIPKVIGISVLFVILYSPRLVDGWLATRIVPANAATGIAGVVIAAAGIALAITGRRSLGPNWSDLVVIKQDHTLVVNGPYRWVRHPLYLGFIIGMFGSAVAVGAAKGFIATAICCLGLFVKARKEEALLRRQFPAGYPDYMRRVKGWVPFVL